MYSIEQLQSLRIGSENASYFQLYAEWNNLVATEQEQTTLSQQTPRMYYNASATLQVCVLQGSTVVVATALTSLGRSVNLSEAIFAPHGVAVILPTE